ncbi:hypothetical protein GGH94_001075 [Coemansia aciculifera]|uniref:CBM21 domain-containing protein n=1 Tax=Coemansia aciculifera TaxID=417176 RepID=A0A9W8M8H8_9FUNG|nr:hypothetical protein GGH94_001075 [Coemansia aciculifera]
MTMHPCSRPLTLVLQSAAQKPHVRSTPPTTPHNAAGHSIKPCIKKRSSTTAQLPQLTPVPRFVHFDTQLEHTRLFYKSDTPKCAACDPAPVSQIHDTAPQTAYAAAPLSLTPVRRPTSSFVPYEDAPVVLESVELTGLALTGCIKVHNMAYEKAVTVRLTRDNWKTAEDVPATYLRSIIGADGRCPGVDRFAFTISCASIAAPTTISMCVCYRVSGQEHWDNNKGANYSFILAPQAVATAALQAKPTASSAKVRSSTRSFTRGFDAPASRPTNTTSTNANSLPLPTPSVSPADTRRYMRYSEARFAAATPAPPPVRTPSPIMRTGSPLAAAYIWAPCPAALLHC